MLIISFITKDCVKEFEIFFLAKYHEIYLSFAVAITNKIVGIY